MGGWWRWALVSLDAVVPSRMVSVSASVNLPLHHKVENLRSSLLAPAHPGGPGKSAVKGRKTVVVVWWFFTAISRWTGSASSPTVFFLCLPQKRTFEDNWHRFTWISCLSINSVKALNKTTSALAGLQDTNPTIWPQATPPPPVPTACTILFVDTQSVAAYIPESNAAPVTPHEPKFTKRREDLSG